jgi:AcrR family transcriptional regulator
MGRRPDPQRRQQLLDAVGQYILDVGLADLSLRPIAAKLGTSPRMLLYYFDSKEGLLVEALRQIRLWQQEEAARWFARETPVDPASMLERAWRWFSSTQAAPFMRLFFEVYGLALQGPSRYRGFLEDVVVDWMPFAEAVVNAIGVPVAEAPQRATLLIAVHRGLLLDLLATGERERIDASYRQLITDLTRERTRT